jgi:protocatechuate 3,4-dioxygenase beta subunit
MRTLIVRPALVALAAAVAAGALSHAQQPAAPRIPASPIGQVRDPTGRGTLPTVKIGTGVISGAVSVAGTGQPSWGARVSLSGADIGGQRSMTTDNQGRFSFTALPPGRYMINVNKPGYVNVSYGQRRVGGGSTPIILGDGEQRDISIALPRGGVITGMVFDERGEPAINVPVRGMRFMLMNGVRRLSQTAGASTDDRGVYRLHSLQPGEYSVCVSPQHMGPQNDAQRMQMELESLRRTLENPNGPPANVRQSMTARMAQLQAQLSDQAEPATGYAPICYPGGGTAASAPILVNAGEERGGIDIQLHLTLVARIEGMVVIPPGVTPQSIQITMGNVDEAMGNARDSQGTRVEESGKFRFQNIAPGRYVVVARTMPGPPPPPRMGGPAAPPRGNEPKLWAMVEVPVNGQDVTDVVLELHRGAPVSGQVVFQPTTMAPPADLTKTQISLYPFSPNVGGPTLESNASGTVDATGRFTIPDVFPGKYRISASAPGGQGGQGWIMESIMAGAEDALDFPLEVKPGQSVSGVVITMGDRPTELAGTVVDEKGQPATEHTLLLYPVDQKYWTPQSRRIRTLRAGSDGSYIFRAVPPGDYRLTTLMDPEPGIWYDRQVLEQLDTTSIRITLLEGDKKVEHVRVRAGQ